MRNHTKAPRLLLIYEADSRLLRGGRMKTFKGLYSGSLVVVSGLHCHSLSEVQLGLMRSYLLAMCFKLVFGLICLSFGLLWCVIRISPGSTTISPLQLMNLYNGLRYVWVTYYDYSLFFGLSCMNSVIWFSWL